MNSGKIGADGWTDGRTDEGSIRGPRPRGPKKAIINPCTRGRQRVAPTEDVNGSDRDKRCQLDGI